MNENVATADLPRIMGSNAPFIRVLLPRFPCVCFAVLDSTCTYGLQRETSNELSESLSVSEHQRRKSARARLRAPHALNPDKPWALSPKPCGDYEETGA